MKRAWIFDLHCLVSRMRISPFEAFTRFLVILMRLVGDSRPPKGFWIISTAERLEAPKEAERPNAPPSRHERERVKEPKGAAEVKSSEDSLAKWISKRGENFLKMISKREIFFENDLAPREFENSEGVCFRQGQ